MRAELQHLRLQLDPHFLFNALNTLAAEIPERPQAALEMTRRIAAYLRYSLDKHNRQVCPLADEIDAVRAYIRIQELRFEDRLRCRIEVDPATRSVAVPHLVVQGLVENAIKHGLEPKAEGGRLEIVAEVVDGDLFVHVIDTGVGFMPKGDGGVGLANVRERLHALYGDRAELIIAVPPGGGTRATIRVPYEITRA